jgi:hypothetical protein
LEAGVVDTISLCRIPLDVKSIEHLLRKLVKLATGILILPVRNWVALDKESALYRALSEGMLGHKYVEHLSSGQNLADEGH